MPTSFDDPFADDLDDEQTREIERRMNIHRLKNEANDIAGGQMQSFESPDAPAEILEEFWKNVVEFERAPRVSMLQKLDDAGISIVPASDLSDAELHARLWQLIEFMAEQKTYLSDTDHLSDHELYEFLREQAADSSMPDFPGMNCHLSPIGSCGEEDMIISFRFFADDEARAHWMESFPDYVMPPRETPPYSRDHLLPQATYPHMEMEGDENDEFADWEEDESQNETEDETQKPEN